MRHHMVRYTVRPDCVAEQEALILALYEDLERVRPSGLGHASFRLDDQLSYVHLVALAPNEKTNPMLEVPAFRALRDGLGRRAVGARVETALHEVGSFRMLS